MESLYITVFCIVRWKLMRIPLKMLHRLWIDPLHTNHHKVFTYNYRSNHSQSKYTFIFHMTWLMLLCKLNPANVLNSQLTCTYLFIRAAAAAQLIVLLYMNMRVAPKLTLQKPKYPVPILKPLWPTRVYILETYTRVRNRDLTRLGPGPSTIWSSLASPRHCYCLLVVTYWLILLTSENAAHFTSSLIRVWESCITK